MQSEYNKPVKTRRPFFLLGSTLLSSVLQVGVMVVRWRLVGILLVLAEARGQDFYNSDYADYYHPGEGNASSLLYPDYGVPDATTAAGQQLFSGLPADQASAVQLTAEAPLAPAAAETTNPEPPEFSPLTPLTSLPDQGGDVASQEPQQQHQQQTVAQPRTPSDFFQPGLESLSEQNLVESDQVLQTSDITGGQDQLPVPTESEAPALPDIPRATVTEEKAARAEDLCLVENNLSNIGRQPLSLLIK
jgi:hypothetical protein